jgi:hypothetical protein
MIPCFTEPIPANPPPRYPPTVAEKHHQLLPGGAGRIKRALDIGAGLHPQGSALDREYAVQAGHVDDDAALERDGLAVIAGTAASQGDRHPVPDCGGDDRAHVLLAARLHHHVGNTRLKLRGKHGAVPVKIFRLDLALAQIGRGLDALDVAAKLLNRVSCHCEAHVVIGRRGNADRSVSAENLTCPDLGA